jgi:spore germination cell wall hydrolase CwlJ-like protein
VTAFVVLACASVAAGGAEQWPAVPPENAAPVQITLTPPKTTRAPIAPAEIAPSAAAKAALGQLLAESHCLAEVIYYEARGESEEGQKAVAQVILNRLAAGRHGNTICRVAYQGAHQTFCQFTYVCDGSLYQPRLPEDWRAAQVLAARILSGQTSLRSGADGATSYHAISVRPSWAPRMHRVAQIGNHVFYRPTRSESPLQNAAFRGSLR